MRRGAATISMNPLSALAFISFSSIIICAMESRAKVVALSQGSGLRLLALGTPFLFSKIVSLTRSE
jgi:hypothetical protein